LGAGVDGHFEVLVLAAQRGVEQKGDREHS
jgi:hypothetical protein